MDRRAMFQRAVRTFRTGFVQITRRRGAIKTSHFLHFWLPHKSQNLVLGNLWDFGRSVLDVGSGPDRGGGLIHRCEAV